MDQDPGQSPAKPDQLALSGTEPIESEDTPSASEDESEEEAVTTEVILSEEVTHSTTSSQQMTTTKEQGQQDEHNTSEADQPLAQTSANQAAQTSANQATLTDEQQSEKSQKVNESEHKMKDKGSLMTERGSEIDGTDAHKFESDAGLTSTIEVENSSSDEGGAETSGSCSGQAPGETTEAEVANMEALMQMQNRVFEQLRTSADQVRISSTQTISVVEIWQSCTV